MTDHDALLRAIVENPAEDTPRLVFADWLDEHADAFPTPAAVRSRAAFIRDDIAMSRCDEYDPLRLRWELVEKPQREAEAWAREALPPLPLGCAFGSAPRFRRGFPWAVEFTTKGRAVHEPPADAVPLECVRYRHCGSVGIERLRAARWRARLTAVEFDGGLDTPIRPARLFALDGLDRLDRLAFVEHAINPAEVRELVGSPLFGRLATLTVVSPAPGPPGSSVAAEVTRGGTASVLRELHLVGCRTSPAALAELLASPATSYLDALAAGGGRMAAPDKFRALAGVTRPPPLRSLDMHYEAPNEAGLEALLASPLVPGLRRLVLSSCALTGDRTRLLAAGAFGGLRALDVSTNPVGNAGAAALARSPHFARLLVLNLSYCMVGDEGVEALLESPLADGLVLLDLSGSPASAEMKEALRARMGDRVRV